MDASETESTGLRATAARENSDEERAAWYRRRWTTIVLETDRGGWRATQTSIAVEGRGETAADAAADYCRRLAETGGGN